MLIRVDDTSTSRICSLADSRNDAILGRDDRLHSKFFDGFSPLQRLCFSTKIGPEIDEFSAQK